MAFFLEKLGWAAGFGTTGVGVGTIATGVKSRQNTLQSAVFTVDAGAAATVGSVIAGTAGDATLLDAMDAKVCASPSIAYPALFSSGRRSRVQTHNIFPCRGKTTPMPGRTSAAAAPVARRENTSTATARIRRGTPRRPLWRCALDAPSTATTTVSWCARSEFWIKGLEVRD